MPVLSFADRKFPDFYLMKNSCRLVIAVCTRPDLVAPELTKQYI